MSRKRNVKICLCLILLFMSCLFYNPRRHPYPPIEVVIAEYLQEHPGISKVDSNCIQQLQKPILKGISEETAFFILGEPRKVVTIKDSSGMEQEHWFYRRRRYNGIRELIIDSCGIVIDIIK